MQVRYPISSIWRSCATVIGEIGDDCSSKVFGKLSSYRIMRVWRASGRPIRSPRFYHIAICAFDPSKPLRRRNSKRIPLHLDVSPTTVLIYRPASQLAVQRIWRPIRSTLRPQQSTPSYRSPSACHSPAPQFFSSSPSILLTKIAPPFFLFVLTSPCFCAPSDFEILTPRFPASWASDPARGIGSSDRRAPPSFIPSAKFVPPRATPFPRPAI